MFNFSLSVHMQGARASVAPPSGFVTLTAFSRDRTLFDAGAAFGRSSATIPVQGLGTAGEPVEARAVSLDDGGATTTAWADVGTRGREWQLERQITVPRGASWYRPEARLKAQPAVSAQAANRFGVGHVIAIWGQSEPERIINAFYDNTTPPPVRPRAVQIFVGAADTPQRVLISDSQPYTAGVAAMASSLIAARPGEKFAVIFHTVPGTDPRALVDDADTSRLWAADKALHDFAVADGQRVGLPRCRGMPRLAISGELRPGAVPAVFRRTCQRQRRHFPDRYQLRKRAELSCGSLVRRTLRLCPHQMDDLWPHRFDIDSDSRMPPNYANGPSR